MCTSNQERICFLIEGRASLPLRGYNQRGAPHIWLCLSSAFLKKLLFQVGENIKWGLENAVFMWDRDSERLYKKEGGKNYE